MDNQNLGVRGQPFLADGIEAGAAAFIAECRQIVGTSDPTVVLLPEPKIVQMAVNLAVQRILHWVSQYRVEGVDPDAFRTDAIVGVLTGLGISVAMFHYDPEEVMRGALPAFGKAWLDGMQLLPDDDGPIQ